MLFQPSSASAGASAAARLCCLLVHVSYGFLASDGGLLIPETIKSSELFDLTRMYFPIIEKSGHEIIFKNGNSSYKVSPALLYQLTDEGLPCLYNTEKVNQIDGDYLIHMINHARISLFWKYWSLQSYISRAVVRQQHGLIVFDFNSFLLHFKSVSMFFLCSRESQEHELES